MVTKFNYTPLRNTALALVKRFGKSTLCSLLRNVNATPDDVSKPWRGADPTIKEFRFFAVALTKPFSSEGNGPRGDVKLIMPGDIVTTTAEGDPMTVCGMPLETDRITVEQIPGTVIEYGILGIQDVTPDGDPMILKVDLRAWPLITKQPQTPF
jgi:hypothetical protein